MGQISEREDAQDRTGDNILFFCIRSTISACLTHVISSLLGVLFVQANIPTHQRLCYYYYYYLGVSKRMNEMLIPAITIEISLMRSANVTVQCHSYDVISHSIGHAAVLIWSPGQRSVRERAEHSVTHPLFHPSDRPSIRPLVRPFHSSRWKSTSSQTRQEIHHSKLMDKQRSGNGVIQTKRWFGFEISTYTHMERVSCVEEIIASVLNKRTIYTYICGKKRGRSRLIDPFYGLLNSFR